MSKVTTRQQNTCTKGALPQSVTAQVLRFSVNPT